MAPFSVKSKHFVHIVTAIRRRKGILDDNMRMCVRSLKLVRAS